MPGLFSLSGVRVRLDRVEPSAIEEELGHG
jgi:hypothetical protein